MLVGMDHDHLLSASGRRIALLIDADNVSHGKIAAMLAELSKYGTAHIRRAYGNWASPSMNGWAGKLHEFAIRPIQQFNYSKGKNATDIALVIDAMELLYTQKPDAYCIASSDADFTPLVMQLRAHGQDVYGFGEAKTPTPFVNACSTFLYLDRLEGEAEAETPAGEALPSETKPVPAAAKSPAKPTVANGTKVGSKPLSGNTQLVTILRGAVEASKLEDGWASMAAAGGTAKRLAPIDPRNYGVSNFAALFKAVGLFDIVKLEDGQSYIADKRNKERTKQPERPSKA